MTDITRCDALKKDGLHYLDEETGEEKLIPRCKITDEGYKYSKKTDQYKRYLMKECSQMHPKLDIMTIEIMVDDYLNNPENMQGEMEKDKDYMSKFKE